MSSTNESGDGRWWRFWSRSAWEDWWAARGRWKDHRQAVRALGPDAAVAAPPRPISPAWVPASLLALAIFLTPGEDPATNPEPVAVATTTTTTSSDVVAPETTDSASTTVARPTTSSPSKTSTTSTTSTTISDPLLVPGFGGASGDPTAPPPPGAEMVTVDAITDGDTIRVRRGGEIERLRLIGINSPESGECFAIESARALAALTPVGSEVAVTVDVNDQDDFGRLLRYVWVGGLSVNEELVRRGAAISRRYPPDTSLSGRFEAAQADARQGQVGLWAPDACGPASDAYLRTVEVNYDAPGDDNQNLNEEWIVIANEGDAPVDLTDWSVKDESATHRYHFPTGFVLAPGETVTIRTGCGDDFGTELFWCAVGSAVWNNDGDTVFILDPHGNTHDSYTYSPSRSAAPPTTAAPRLVDAPASGNCDPSYPDVCIPPSPPDLDCGDISHRRFKVIGSDPHRFDGDGNGLGCES